MLLWFLSNDPRLSDGAKVAIADPGSVIAVPAIALAEAARVVRRGRYAGLTPNAFFARVADDPRIAVIAITESIVRRADALSAPSEMHDLLIVATAIELSATQTDLILITRDREITASGLVTVEW